MFLTLTVTHSFCLLFFFFNDTATTEIYTLSLHDALPILSVLMLSERASSSCARLISAKASSRRPSEVRYWSPYQWWAVDRKSTRLNSSHANISYAVFCLKKKKKDTIELKLKYAMSLKKRT